MSIVKSDTIILTIPQAVTNAMRNIEARRAEDRRVEKEIIQIKEIVSN